MADHILERRLWLPRSRAEVFEFFADPASLLRVQPAWARPRWIAPPPLRLDAGVVLDFRLPVLPLAWRVIIREWDAPYRFVDVQLRGPFARWEHRHHFVEGPPRTGGPAGTWIEDRVTYRLPGAALGRLAHALGGGARVRALFDYRDRRLRELFARA